MGPPFLTCSCCIGLNLSGLPGAAACKTWRAGPLGPWLKGALGVTVTGLIVGLENGGSVGPLVDISKGRDEGAGEGETVTGLAVNALGVVETKAVGVTD